MNLAPPCCYLRLAASSVTFPPHVRSVDRTLRLCAICMDFLPQKLGSRFVGLVMSEYKSIKRLQK